MATKISDTEIEMEKVTPEVRTTVKYERGFIDSQIIAVLAQKKAYDEARDIELTELYGIRDEMDKLGIIAKTDTEAKELTK